METPAILQDQTATVPCAFGSSGVGYHHWPADDMGSGAAAPELTTCAAGPLGNFHLVEEIGHGAEGHVFLGEQRDLGNRQVVLKITAAAGREHLSLAKLQHSNIVPLYGVVEDRARRQRALCMPYFGRATLKHLLQQVSSIPCPRRQGKDIVEALDRVAGQSPAGRLEQPRPSTARAFLERATYVQAICWLGAGLAEGLHYAHERGLVHLDVKPSNVLVAADGQPMLLDFHLARPPLAPGDEPPCHFGGTPGYMSPEQTAAGAGIKAGLPIAQPVDARSDIFALGMVLFEALAGQPLSAPQDVGKLRCLNPQVSVGLGDIIQKCLAPESSARYASADALAADLRCLVQDRPFQGVPNRSWRERWQKWRRRRPHVLPLVVLVLGLLGALAGALFLTVDRWQKRRQLAEEFFNKGRTLLQQKQFDSAEENLLRGLELAGDLGSDPALKLALDEHLRLVRRAAQAQKLHRLADSLRDFMLFPSDDQRTLIVLDVGCRQAWEKRHMLLDRQPPLLEPALEQRLSRDLGDLAAGWAELRVRLAPPAQLKERRLEAVALLTEAKLWGASIPPMEWQQYQTGPESAEPAEAAPGRQTAGESLLRTGPRAGWEHYLVGRCLLRLGKFELALIDLEKGVALAPADFHGNFCLGVCAARLERHARAVAAFSVCIGQEPLQTEPYLQRGRSHAAQKDWQFALADFDRALLIRPNVPEVLLERANACCRLGLRDRAGQDLKLVLQIWPHHPQAAALKKQLDREPSN